MGGQAAHFSFGNSRMVMVVNVRDTAAILRAWRDRQVTETEAIGALVEGGRTVRQARNLLLLINWLDLPR